MIPIGIDLGTTFSAIGHVNAQGLPALFPDYHDASAFRTPSVVHIGTEGALAGDIVEERLEDEPTLRVARFAKLRMGTGETVYVDELGESWSSEAISAIILRKLLRDATAFGDDAPGSAVVTVPAQFGDAARRATKEAAAMAGLVDVRLIEEPIAAATYYGLRARNEETLFVYDLGGGTFDATVLHAAPDGLYVLATSGSERVGGKRFDEALMEMVAEQFRREHGIDPMSDPTAAHQLRRFAERLKIRLGRPGRGQIAQTLLLCGRTCDVVLTRSQFDKAIGPLLEETLEACERALKGSGLSWSTVDRVLLTGGSTLLPAVQRCVQSASQKPADRFLVHQPHQAVAFGAALISAESAKADSGTPKLLQRIATTELGLRIRDPRNGEPGVQPLIKRNMPLPARYTGTFYTTRPDQRRLILELVQRKNEDSEPVSLGHFSFGPITRPRKNYPVEVTLSYDVEGLVQVVARDPASGQQMEHILEDTTQSGMATVARESQRIQRLRLNE